MGIILAMWKDVKTTFIVFGFFLGVLSVFYLLVVLQPSSQEAASDSILAAEAGAQSVFSQLKATEATSKLDQAVQSLALVKADAEGQKQINQAIATINSVRTGLAYEEGKVGAASAEVQAHLEHAKNNLVVYTRAEQIKSVKDQILALAWPLMFGLIILYILHSQSSIRFFRQVASVISNVKIPGALEIQFHGTAVKSNQEEVLREYRRQVIASYDAVATQYKISETMSRIVEGPITQFYGGRLPNGFRCTVHVADMLFKDSYYQLIDYLPRSASGAKGTHGRAWSVRRGIVGLAWRLEEDQAEGTVPHGVAGEKELIKDWGMLKEEAEAAPERQTSLCYLVKAQNQSPIAAIYLDAKQSNEFGPEGKQSLIWLVGNSVKQFGLDQSLEQVWRQVQGSAPLIEIYGANK